MSASFAALPLPLNLLMCHTTHTAVNLTTNFHVYVCCAGISSPGKSSILFTFFESSFKEKAEPLITELFSIIGQ